MADDQAVSLGHELVAIDRALSSVKRLLESDELEASEERELVREGAAILSLLRGRLALVIWAVRKSTDPRLLLADHNSCPAAPDPSEDPDIRLLPWDASSRPRGARHRRTRY